MCTAWDTYPSNPVNEWFPWLSSAVYVEMFYPSMYITIPCSSSLYTSSIDSSFLADIFPMYKDLLLQADRVKNFEHHNNFFLRWDHFLLTLPFAFRIFLFSITSARSALSVYLRFLKNDQTLECHNPCASP